MTLVGNHQGIGEMLLMQGAITQDQLRVALREQERSPGPLLKHLVELGFMSEIAAQQTLQHTLGVRAVNLDEIVPDPEALDLLPHDVAKRCAAFPVAFEPSAQTLYVAVSDPGNILLLDQIGSQCREPVRVEALLASAQDIFHAIDRHYGHQLSIDGLLAQMEANPHGVVAHGDSGQPVVRLIDALLVDAVKQRASDIHFEPEAGFLRIRYRVDGILHRVHVVHRSHWSAMAIRLKVISGMDITESRAPQDGRLTMQIGGRSVDFRASAHPTIHGENIVLRILDREKGILPLDELGLEPQQLSRLRTMTRRPEGILLITGPTGSGKTTTLYSLLSEINSEGLNIMTLEDPVEHSMPLIRQTSLAEAVKLDFATGVRSLMRQDPDVILVGEIRDKETAEMAFRASMTGHQVFSTLHANSALGALPRLMDIGIRPGLLAGNLIGIVAQRLVRKLCCRCKKAYAPSPEELASLAMWAESCPELFRAPGCNACGNKGYRGRTAIMELLPFTPELEDLVAKAAGSQELLQAALQTGFRTLAQQGIELVRRGVTSLAEMTRVVAFP